MILPVDPSLSANEGDPPDVTLPVLADSHTSAPNWSDTTEVRQPFIVIAEGLPAPITQKTLEKSSTGSLSN